MASGSECCAADAGELKYGSGRRASVVLLGALAGVGGNRVQAAGIGITYQSAS